MPPRARLFCFYQQKDCNMSRTIFSALTGMLLSAMGSLANADCPSCGSTTVYYAPHGSYSTPAHYLPGTPISATGVQTVSYAQPTSNIQHFANQLHRSGRLYHDPGYSGYEVVYRSSGIATREAAIAAWQRSPAHSRILPRITSIHCSGNVCVGR
jgi:hypothetical protein